MTKSNEQIVAEAMVNAGAPMMHSRVEESVVAALRDAGRLADIPTHRCGCCGYQFLAGEGYPDGCKYAKCAICGNEDDWEEIEND